jgi:glycine cleavage system H protein
MAAENPKNCKYTKDHEWARKDGGKITVGVTAHAQEQLGDVVYVELPKIGATVTAGGQFGVVESTKAVSDLYAPVSGKVTKVNDALSKEPATINSDPYGAGWIIELEATGSEYDSLLDADAYTALVAAAK